MHNGGGVPPVSIRGACPHWAIRGGVSPMRVRTVGFVISQVTKKKPDIRIIESDTAGVSERTPAQKKVSERTRRVQGA